MKKLNGNYRERARLIFRVCEVFLFKSKFCGMPNLTTKDYSAVEGLVKTLPYSNIVEWKKKISNELGCWAFDWVLGRMY